MSALRLMGYSVALVVVALLSWVVGKTDNAPKRQNGWWW